LSYEDLEQAILKAEAPDGSGGHPRLSLYEAVAAGHEDKNEEDFIDAVSLNLERGRFLLLIIGDGIREGAESIATFLQQHAGMHFTLGLVDLAVFELPGEMAGYLVQPRILARTRMIDRGIVTIENGRITAKPPSDLTIGPKGVARRTTISEEKFYEELAAVSPTMPRLKAFAGRLEAIGIAIEFGKGTMILRWRPDETPWNLGSIATSGRVWTDVVNWKPNTVGLLNLSHAYLKRLASLVPGAHVQETPKPTHWYVAKGRTPITLDELLAYEDGWFAAIQEFMAAATDALGDR
jgi:hypothetical protein